MNLTNPGYPVILLAFVVAISTVWAIARQKKLPFAFFILRLVTLCILLFLLFQPTLSIFEKKPKPYVAVLIDASRSMAFANRLKESKNFINSNLSALKGNFTVDFYQFSKNAFPLKQEEIKGLVATGDATDIYRSLEQVSNSKNYDGIILLSDGINNREQGSGAIEVPVIAFSNDETNVPKDISIANLKVSDFIFKNIPAEVTVGFYASGYYNNTAKILLSKNKEIVASKQVTIDKPYQEVNFEFTSNKLGVETYNVEITPMPGESIIANNSRAFTVETIREKIRVLYICGQPSPEYYYLRYLMKSNPSVELVSFVILRNPEDVEVVPDEQLSLIPFPQNEIFTKDLFDYDIFILENFDYSRFNIPFMYLTNIKKFVVEKGGGFLMIGGKNAFGKGNYAGTAIEEILPVTLDKPEDEPVTGLFKLKFLNYSHPIMNIAEDKKDIEKTWNELTEVDGCQNLTPKPGATVIAVHPSQKAGDKNIVCIAAQEIGKGKTLALGINTTWRWLFGEAQEGKSTGLYTKFWENVIYWLSGSQQTKEFRISLTQKNYLQGDDINFKLIITNDVLRKKRPLVTVTDPMSKITRIDNLRQIPQGWAGTFTPQMPGEYLISGQVEKGRDINANRIISQDKKFIQILTEISSEDYDLSANPKLMKDIADSTGGMYFSSLDYFPEQEIMSILKKKPRLILKKQIQLASNPAFYFAILILLMAEWIMRKIKGLI